MKKSSQERFALKILLDRPKARNEVWFLFPLSAFAHCRVSPFGELL